MQPTFKKDILTASPLDLPGDAGVTPQRRANSWRTGPRQWGVPSRNRSQRQKPDLSPLRKCNFFVIANLDFVDFACAKCIIDFFICFSWGREPLEHFCWHMRALAAHWSQAMIVSSRQCKRCGGYVKSVMY